MAISFVGLTFFGGLETVFDGFAVAFDGFDSDFGCFATAFDGLTAFAGDAGFLAFTVSFFPAALAGFCTDFAPFAAFFAAFTIGFATFFADAFLTGFFDAISSPDYNPTILLNVKVRNIPLPAEKSKGKF